MQAMGNCFKSTSSSEEFILLRDNSSLRDLSEEPSLPLPDQEAASGPVYYLTPSKRRRACELTEEEQIEIVERIDLIQQVPKGLYDDGKKERECVICLEEFAVGDAVHFLPCMHIYHLNCIEDWLMRSFTCPSCMKPVDVTHLTNIQTK
ncbi:hypothetical protein HPB50_003351 [Hyalomma asiaticum]|uniref:Uncharacterized protein n=1 Tax=Hyalomma asiaticum TaxID=266040 RepID=A0ACB7TAF5_HYAAI|nr:hypothetical protein HPB50_003351 [Hyalomma asiaticum]